MATLLREVLQGVARLHILSRAARAPVSGVEIREDLAAHGYPVSPGTLYPLLHGMEKAGWVKSKDKNVKGKRRRYYRATRKGRVALDEAREKLRQLTAIVLDGSRPAGPCDGANDDVREGTDDGGEDGPGDDAWHSADGVERLSFAQESPA